MKVTSEGQGKSLAVRCGSETVKAPLYSRVKDRFKPFPQDLQLVVLPLFTRVILAFIFIQRRLEHTVLIIRGACTARAHQPRNEFC